MEEQPPVNIPAWIRSRFPADQRAAVDYLRQIIDEEMLTTIAAADYGRDLEKHLEALKPVWLGGDLKELDPWFPMEVLELYRWTETEDSPETPNPDTLQVHRMRAFSCAVLLATPNFEPDKETLIQMLDSVLTIGAEAADAMGRFLIWRIDHLGRSADRPFFALAIAAILHFGNPKLTPQQGEELAAWVSDEEEAEREYLASFDPRYKTVPWLFGLSFMTMRNSRWSELIMRIRNESESRALRKLLVKHTLA